jgi:hypothetical protein
MREFFSGKCDFSHIWAPLDRSRFRRGRQHIRNQVGLDRPIDTI